jgi:hypothetical protein
MMNSMAGRKNSIAPQAGADSINGIFELLSEGVNEQEWQRHADELRGRGYGVFDLRIAGSGDVEIISPDCQDWWQLQVDAEGCWRLH